MMTQSTVPLAFEERKIDAVFAELDQCQFPGAAVGIAIDGKPVYRKGFGLASMELPVALSPSVRMRIYSGSIHFLGVLSRELSLQATAEFGIPSLKSSPELVIEDVHPHLQ